MTISVTFFCLFLLIVGFLITFRFWLRRNEDVIRRNLLIMWLIIVFAILLIAVFDLPVAVIMINSMSVNFLRGFGLPKLLAQAFSALLIAPFVWAIGMAFSWRERKRYIGIGVIGVHLFICFLLAYLLNPNYNSGYVVQLNGTLQHCDDPGEVDLNTLRPCNAMIPEVKAIFKASKEKNPALFVTNPSSNSFYSPEGKSLLWYCAHPEKESQEFLFALAPVFDPSNGKKCVLITDEIVNRYNFFQRQSVMQRVDGEDESTGASSRSGVSVKKFARINVLSVVFGGCGILRFRLQESGGGSVVFDRARLALWEMIESDESPDIFRQRQPLRLNFKIPPITVRPFECAQTESDGCGGFKSDCRLFELPSLETYCNYFQNFNSQWAEVDLVGRDGLGNQIITKLEFFVP